MQAQETLPKWEPGFLDVHFIATGGGNCAMVIMPDGTNMLVDAGELDPTSPRTLSPRNTRRFPDYSKMAYQWQSDYIREMIPKKDNTLLLDYALVTHFHEDHFGSKYPGVPYSEKGNYFVSGITGVAEEVGIHTLVDRGWNYPADLRKISREKSSPDVLANYFSFVDWSIAHADMRYEEFKPGVRDQFIMRYHPEAYPTFTVENIQSNGIILKDGKPYTLMPAINTAKKIEMPGENHLSAGILLRYGEFKCYMGGDIPGTAPDFEQKSEWHDVESVVAPIVGEVDVTTANHHANRDAMTHFYLSVLKPRVIIQEVWSSDHPGHEALLRMTSQKIWKGERDLFSTAMLEANRLVIGELIENSYKSMSGHIVLRVTPGGEQYSIYILNNETPSKHITAVHGPYSTKEKQ